MFLDAGISPDPDTHLCPYCGSFDTMYEGKNGPMCCPNNMVYDEINDGCTCPDGSQSWPTNYGPPQCPGDCPAGEYLAHRTLDEKFCCPVGSTPTINGYDDVTCTCFDNNPPDPVNGCPTPCGPGLVPWDDSYNGNQQIACCPPGKIWYPWRNECMCNGEYLGYNNACEGDCSPGWYKWSEDLCCAVGGSMMWDGSADVCKCPGGTSPNSETGCGFCSNKEIAYRKRDGSEICCQKNMKFNYQSDQCECEGQPLTPTFSPATCKGDCPVGKWIQFKDSGEMICCAIGSWWDVSFQKCMCPDQNEADPDTGCSMCAVDEQIYFDNSGNTRCCRTNQYFDLSWDECRCMDGTRPYNSQCPGDCELGEVMEQFYPEKICCPIGAYWNANAEECICFNGALVDNRCEVNDCAQMDIALITADGVRCCPKNQIWHEGNCRCPDKTNPGSSYNTQGGNGDYNPHPQECPGDCPYGQRFFLDNKGDIVCCPGETGYSAITDTCTCPNGGTYDYENNKCPYCNNNREKEWTDPNGNKMCCTLNQVLTDYSCTCEDGSNPDQNMQCPGDCPQEEYLSDILGGELICCPVGSSLQMMNGVQTATCICDQTGNEPDVETGCNLCNSNQIAFQTGGQWSAHKCCASNLIYSPNANDCTCSNGLPPNGDGSCPGDCAAGFFFVGEYSEVICCPLGSAYNSALEQCQCPDGSEAGDSPCPLCPTHMSSHWTSNGEEKCCFAHTEWSEDLDDCACSDGSFLGPFMMCEDTCAQGEYLVQPHPFQCCPLGSVFEEGECKCSDGGPLDSTYCGQCPENSNAFLDFDNGMTKCCPGNQKWVNGTTGCVCEDESMPLAFGSCPGDCNAGMYPAGIDLNNTLICCPDGAYLDSGECLCNSGSPVINNTCPPCSPNRSPFYDTAGNLLECCLNSQKYIEDTGKCICKDDSLPGYMSACPGDCVSADLFVVQQDPELKCCKAGEYYDQVDQECKCPNGQSYQNNNACGYCDINVGDDGVFNPAINSNGDILCCKINHQYSLEIDDCGCPNGDPFDQYGGCPGDCDPGQILGYVDPTDTLDPIKCCPENSWYDMADKLCKCNSGFAIVNDTCPYCPEHKDVYFDASQNPRCCHKNQMFDQGVEQCICKSDGSIPGYSMNCPNDCDEGEWLGSFEPLECCEIGAKWTSDLGCHCTNGAPLNGTGCGECSDNEIVGFNKDNGAITCCKSNQIFSNSSYECLCPENNSPPWQNGECPGDCEPGFFFASNIDEVLCCPNDSSYDSWMNSCICNNGGIYDPDTGCPPCPPPTVLQTDSNNQTQCCQINQVVTTYGACMCEDGSYPDGPMGSCGNECIDYGDGYWLQSVYPTIECCPLNSYWSDTDGKCYCPNDPAEIPDETGCGYCSISQRTHLDQYGVVQCCEKNKVWFDEDDYTVAGCYCKDGSNSEPNGECPGDCPEDKVFIQAFPRTICCEIGSVYDPIGDECMCPNGEVVDDTACGLCSDPGMRALFDQNDAIRCCERNQIWIADENNPAGGHCRCKDGSEAINLPPSYFPQCGDECEEGTYFVGPNHPTLGCCPYGTQYNSITDECECPNNNEVDDTACGQCSTDQRAHMDEFGNVKCCKRNLFWYDGDDTGPGGCFCDNRTEPFYASNWSTYQQCEIDCEENHVIQFVEPYVQCCPFNSEWNYNLNKCVCDNGDEPDDRACGNCAQPDRAIFDSLGNIQCCQRNLFYFEQDMSGPPGCFCADRSQPLYLTNSMYGECPNDCGEGEYFVRPDPKTICCPLGAEYDNQTKTCKCKFDEPMVDGKCPVCPTGQNPHLDSSFMIQCCDEGFIWIDSLPTMNKCACPGGSTTLPCPPLIQPEQSLCPGDLQYNFNKGECECWDRQAPVDGECNSNTCQDGETAYNNRFGDIMCCPKNTYFKKDRDMCVCTGDLLPTPNGDCPVCAPQETPYVYNDAAGCCPENSYFDQGMLQCKCFFDSTIVEENTGCSPACPPHQIFFKDGGWGNCEDFCQQGQIYNSDSNTCLCPEGHIVGKNEQCPGTPSNCNFDFHPIETENGQVCCHKDAHYSPAHERCICNDGSEPNANQVCSSSCPDGLVYAMYAQSSKMACLCPDTFQYPNVDGICLSSICRTNDVVINFEDGSFACCPVGSTWSSKWNMCICIHQGTLGQCGEKCPDGQISVYNDFNAETECQFVSPCQPGEIQDLAGNCCPQGEVYNDELGLCECPEGQVVIDGSCDSPCPEGSEMEAGSCVSKCPEEQIYKDEECYCADGSLASLTKPCCELGQHWSAEKSLCVCDGGDSCNQVCPDSLPNQFLDVFGKLHCCASDQVFNVREQKCMCMGSFGSKKFADPVDGKCSCPGMKQVITDGAFTCEPSICSPSQIFSPITALCECPADKYPFENDMSGEIECCPAGQKWSNILLMCICIEGNMLPNANGVCEEVEECPPGWYFSGKTHEYGQILTECLPACPDPAMVWFVDSETAANVTSVSCKCKGEFKYTLSTDVPMTNYVTDGWCEPEECPVGMIRSEDVSNFNECVCPYHWQTITDNGGCSCDHPHYSMFFNTCTCKEKVFAYQVFGADGTCQCPIGMAYDPETFGCREDCYFFGEDPSTGEDKCMTKEEFEAAYTANPTPNPLTQIDDTCPGFEVGWKGIKSSRVTLRSSNDNVNSYQILTNVRDNQNNVDVTKDDYIGFLVWSKRHCGYAFIEEIIQGGVTISMWDQSDIYKLQQAYLSQDKSQTQTVLQFKVQHNRDAQGNIIGGNLMVDGKKDQFYLNINVDSSIEFAYGEEYCLTSFNVGVMKSAMNFGENYTYCVPNGGSYWWSKPNNPSLTRDSNQSD